MTLQLAHEEVPDICADLQLSQQVTERATAIAKRCDYEHPINRSPTVVAASVVYVVALAENEKRTQAAVSEAAGCSDVAIRDCYPEIREFEGIPVRRPREGRMGRPAKAERTGLLDSAREVFR